MTRESRGESLSYSAPQEVWGHVNLAGKEMTTEQHPTLTDPEPPARPPAPAWGVSSRAGSVAALARSHLPRLWAIHAVAWLAWMVALAERPGPPVTGTAFRRVQARRIRARRRLRRVEACLARVYRRITAAQPPEIR